MPGTTRYSATFDRPYEEEDEEDLPAVPPLTRRSRSASWQATTANGRPYTPLGGNRHARSSSTDNGQTLSSSSSSPAHSTERIPTRTTGKVSVKTSHNPFQFVKVGTCSLYKKAEEQLKKTQKAKQPEALKEEEEEWQTNLDSWKSRRRKMSQDVFRRQEEMKELLEMDEPQNTGQQKKVKTFSEMLEERASRGRTLSLCLVSNPLGLDDWTNKSEIKDDSEMSCNDTHQSSGSAESSNANSEDENDVFQNTQMTERLKNVNNTQRTRRTGAVHFLGNHNGVNNGMSPSTEDSNCDFKVSDLALNGETLSHKCEPCQGGAFNDSGLDSLSSSHRAGDIPDSGSDFSQDSGSSLDCDSPGITGIPTSGTELLEEFSSKDVHPSNGMISNKEKIDGMELCLKLTHTDEKSQQYGFSISGGKDKGTPVTVASVINGSVSDLVGLKTGDHILAINKEDISSLSHSAVISSLKQSAENRELELLLWRPISSNVKQEKPTLNGSSVTTTVSEIPSKRPVTEQTFSKEICNKTNSKATKVSIIAESFVDNKVDIVNSQSNKKAAPVKQKEVSCKNTTPAKSQTQEEKNTDTRSKITDTSEVTKSSAQTTSVAENQHVRSVESENEMFVDDFDSPPVPNNSKIPVADKSPKVMGKKMSKASQEAKKNKSPMNDSFKSDESSRKTKESTAEDSKDNSLNIIYQSQVSVPKAQSNAKELITADSEHSVSSSVDKKVVSESSKSPAQTSPNKQEPKFNEKLTFEASEILPVDKVAEQMERLILEQLEEEERLKEKPIKSQAPSHDNVITTTVNVLPDHELSSIDTPPRHIEPPKEKPPPPPTSSSSTNKDSPLIRVNSTKRIKKEIQKRRSDFLGIEKSEEEESVVPPPPDLENILKLECEQERKVREMLGKESLHQRESSFEEEEIARKEREIIENLESEERLRMAKQTVKDENVTSSSNDDSIAQAEVERIRKLQEERVRMEEERFMKEEQRIRLEEERQLREREEQIRRGEAPKTDDLCTKLTQDSYFPVGITAEFENSGNNIVKQKDISLGSSVKITRGTSVKNDSALAASSHIQPSDTNKKITYVKKVKPENKKLKADKQNISSKSENKTPNKLEPTESQIQSVQPPVAQCTMSENIPTIISSKEVVLNLKRDIMSKSSGVSQNVEQNKITASHDEGAKSNVCVTKQKANKIPEVSKNPQPNKQTASHNENIKNSKKHAPEPKSRDVLQNTKQNKNIVLRRGDSESTCISQQESEILLLSQSAEQITKKSGDLNSKMSSEISQDAEMNKKTARQSSDAISQKCVPVQQPKVLEISKNAVLQTAGCSHTYISEQKSKDLPISCNVAPNKMANLQSTDSKPKCISEHKTEALQTQNVESKLASLQTTQKSKICEQKSKSSEQKSKSSEQKSKSSEQKSEASEILPNDEQNKILNKQCESAKSEKYVLAQQQSKTLESSENMEKKPVVPSIGSSSHKTCVPVQNSNTLPSLQNEQKPETSEQKSEVSEIPLNVEPSKISDKECESTKYNKGISVQRQSKTSEIPLTVERNQTVLLIESSINKICASEQNSLTLLASENVELNKQTAPQVEAVKTEKCVAEQKPTGNVVRVRKKKRVPAKSTESENFSAGVSNLEPPSQNRCPLLPTACSKSEDKAGASVISGRQNKENTSSEPVIKPTGVNSIIQKFSATSQNECGKPFDQKNHSTNEIPHNSASLSVAEKNPECKTSSNSEVESSTDASAITSTTAVLSTNSENTALVSPISSSVSNDASLFHIGDGKNKETKCMPSASGDQSSIAKETTNNLVPTKPLKKKEVIRKERERLRQEQEALQREREEYRRQMMKEQELLKESQKPHAPDAPVSRVGVPPPLKPALPLPLTSLPHASQALKENVIYTSRSPSTNPANAAVSNHNTVVTSPSSLLSPSHNAAARPKITQNDAWGSHKMPVVKKQPDAPSESRYNQNHWLIQEAEMRRISEQKERQRVHPSGDLRCAPAPFNQGQYHPMHMGEESYCGGIPSTHQKPAVIPGAPSMLNKPTNYPIPTQMHSPEQQWNYGQPIHPTPQNRKFSVSNVLSPGTDKIQPPTAFPRNVRVDPSMQAPTKPSRVIPMDRQEQMLSVSGRKRCSHCGEELGRGAAMIIESLQLYYHIQCFRCCVCQAQLGNGSCGTDVRVRNNKLHCHNCYSNDEAGLKFSQV